VEPQTVNEELSVEAEVGLSGTEQSTVNAEHFLTSNSAFESLLIDADHRLAEACTSLLMAAQPQTEALPLCAEVGQYEVVESTVAQAIVDVDHASVQSCTSLFSKTQSVIEEFSVAADGDGTEFSNSYWLMIIIMCPLLSHPLTITMLMQLILPGHLQSLL
jgi:hypothetical protein